VEKLSELLRRVVLLGSWIVLTACSQQSYKDVSDHPEYKVMVGQRFGVLSPLLAYGIREHSAAPIKYITLMPPPGIAGSTVVPLGTVQVGAVVTVQAVRLTSRWLDDPVNYLVTVAGSSVTMALPVHIDRFRGNEGLGSRTSLNPSIFRPLPNLQ
jgi:hypothetical protein